MPLRRRHVDDAERTGRQDGRRRRRAVRQPCRLECELVLDDHIPPEARPPASGAVEAPELAMAADGFPQLVHPERRTLARRGAVHRHQHRGGRGRKAARPGVRPGERQVGEKLVSGAPGRVGQRQCPCLFGRCADRAGKPHQLAHVGGVSVGGQQRVPVRARRGGEAEPQSWLVEHARKLGDEACLVVRQQRHGAVGRNGERIGGDGGQHNGHAPLQRGQQLGVDPGGSEDGNHHGAPRQQLGNQLCVRHEAEGVDAALGLAAGVLGAPGPAAPRRRVWLARLPVLPLRPVIGG
mmetsp:Transcript_35212/g.113429  ORF Transcript_35212/g.113429 Transcript_35212/m.113429 type:complete len:294 (+) Transcript_35212:704-1585(+)